MGVESGRMSGSRQSGNARAWVVGLLAFVGLSAGSWVWLERFATYHFAAVTPGVLYRDGNRSLREFTTACRKAGARTVVMLNDDQELQKEPFKTEVEFCRRSGIELVRIPVTLGCRPSSEDVRRFLEVASDKARQPVLVHCAQGVRRTGMMVAAYQESVLGYDDAKAKEAILPWGRKATSLTLEDVRHFIEDYDPVGKVVGLQHAAAGSGDRE